MNFRFGPSASRSSPASRRQPLRQRVVLCDRDPQDRPPIFRVDVVIRRAGKAALVLHPPPLPNHLLPGEGPHVVVYVEDHRPVPSLFLCRAQVVARHPQVEPQGAVYREPTQHPPDPAGRGRVVRAQQLRGRRRPHPASALDGALADRQGHHQRFQTEPQRACRDAVFPRALGTPEEAQPLKHGQEQPAPEMLYSPSAPNSLTRDLLRVGRKLVFGRLAGLDFAGACRRWGRGFGLWKQLLDRLGRRSGAPGRGRLRLRALCADPGNRAQADPVTLRELLVHLPNRLALVQQLRDPLAQRGLDRGLAPSRSPRPEGFHALRFVHPAHLPKRLAGNLKGLRQLPEVDDWVVRELDEQGIAQGAIAGLEAAHQGARDPDVDAVLPLDDAGVRREPPGGARLNRGEGEWLLGAGMGVGHTT